MKLSDFSVLTFDCYGTLIDWETGLMEAFQPLLRASVRALSRNEVLETFATYEATQEAATPGMPYSELLAEVHRQLALKWKVNATDRDHEAFGQSVGDWPAFQDSQQALAYLKRYYKLVILSNVDRSGFAGSAKKLGVAFDAVYTAQDIGSYKPDLRNFRHLIERLSAAGVDKSQVLHTAQSLHHDHAPANQIGLANVWIDRRHDQPGLGATVAPTTTPFFNFRFPSLADMVMAHQAEQR